MTIFIINKAVDKNPPKYGFGKHSAVVPVKGTVNAKGTFIPPHTQTKIVGKKPLVEHTGPVVVVVDVSDKIKQNRILKYGKADISALLAEVENLSDKNIDAVKKLVRENENVKNYLKDVWRTVSKRPTGKGKEIRLTDEQLIAGLEVGKFAFISAERNGLNNPPEHQGKTQAYFETKNKELKQDLINKGYLFSSGRGKYGGLPEDSYLVMVHDGSEEDMTKLAEKYQQNSIILHNGLSQFFKKTYGHKKGELLNGKDYVVNNDLKRDNYTMLKTANNKSYKITLSFESSNTFWEA